MSSIKKLYPCDPSKHNKCSKIACYIYGGPCEYTSNKEYALEMSEMNVLHDMLEKQGRFQCRLDSNFYKKSDEERVAFIKEHSIHLNQEINEMLYELPFFKPWKDYSGMSHEEINEAFGKARMECIDAWHFFMNIMIVLGFDADSFYEMYCAKNNENHRRQDDGYTADKSYRNQSVEEVMSRG